jgi:decaprenylphospho-beta-D-ribofuranose 2-oxidase
MAELDRLVLECGGIPNIIKDSRLSQSVVAAAYPEYEKFRTMLREFDPDRFYRSELSERLAL